MLLWCNAYSIVIGNGIGDPSSNPGPGGSNFTLC